MNYKIRVENEAESKEAQDLLFELGYSWNIKGREKDYLNIRGFTHLTTFDKYIGQGFGFVDHKEITLPELRDIVVLNRETLNDQVASAETARQSEKVLKEILEGSLPEFDFESNVEQDNVNQPVHYCSHPSGIECIEITRHHDFAIGNAIKYLWRAGLKDSSNEIQDLEKSIWYIQDKINQLKKQNANSCKD